MPRLTDIYVVTVRKTRDSEVEPVSPPVEYWQAIELIERHRRRVSFGEIWDCGLRKVEGNV